MAFSPQTKEDSLVASARHCSLCHKFCGIKIELHHIIQEAEGGDNSFDNCIPLCFDCHADMRSYDHKHPKGTKYTPGELKRHRDLWYQKATKNLGTGTNEHLKQDINTFNFIIALLPPDGTIHFIRDANFAGWSFKTSSLDDFENFLHKFKQEPFREFFDLDLEGYRCQLIDTITKLSLSIARDTFPVNGAERKNHIPPELELKDPETFERIVSQLHDLCDSTIKNYDDLIRLGRKKLGIDI